MKVFIKVNNDMCELEIDDDIKISDLKKKISKLTKVPSNEQSLLFGECRLTDEYTVKYYGITNSSIINVLRLSDQDIVEDIMINTSIKKLSDNCENLALEHDANKVETENENLSQNQSKSNNMKQCRGICVIINNRKFDGHHNERFGTEFDEAKIRTTFEPLNYEIEVYPDVKSKAIEGIITQIKANIKKEHNLFIMFILSHGSKDGVIFSDGISRPLKDIWSPFSNKNFRLLIGKAKLFFFACCQGNEFNTGVDVNDSSDEDNSIEHDGNGRTKFPEYADIFLGYSTYKSYVACRVKNEGTFYIQSLCDVIQANDEWNISDIHQETQKNVSERLVKGQYFQMPYYVNLLTRHAYLKD